jgi:hypothetical protein
VDPSFCPAFDFINNQRQWHGSPPKSLKDTMYTIPSSKPVKVLSRPSPQKQPCKSTSTWQPQQTSLTREEVRAIILEQIG